MIRMATLDDMDQMVELGEMMHNESIYTNFPYDKTKCADMAHRYITRNDKLCLVLVEDDVVLGFFLAGIVEQYFGPGRLASQMLFYIHPQYRGGMTAVRFMKKFEHWARYLNLDGLVFSQSANGMDDRWNKFLENLGYRATGQSFMKEFANVR